MTKYLITIRDNATGARTTHEIVSDSPLPLVVEALCGDTHTEVSTVTFEGCEF